jgi:hypothetical protein
MGRVGLFSKKEKVQRCEMCEEVVAPGDKFAHRSTHVVKIGPMEPAWLPDGLRAQAQGEYTFRCDRCNSFPDQKWPSDGGAESAMDMHLGLDHHVGQFAGNYAMRSAVRFNMVPIR